MRLRAALNREEFGVQFAGAPLFAQFSSLGSLDARWVEEEFRVSLSAGRHSGGEHVRCRAGWGGAGQSVHEMRGLQQVEAARRRAKEGARMRAGKC